MSATILLNLVMFLVQSTVLILAGLLIAKFLGRNRAALRQIVYRCTFAAVLACPLISLFFPKFSGAAIAVYLPEHWTMTESSPVVIEPETSKNAIPVMIMLDAPVTQAEIASDTWHQVDFQPVTGIPAIEKKPQVEVQAAQITMTSEPIAVETQKEAKMPPFQHFAMFFFAFWGAGAVFFLTRIAASRRRSVGLIRHAVSVDDALETRLNSMMQLLRIRPRVRLLQNPFLSSPCLLGIRRPTLLLPDAIPENDREVDAILVHELAHLLRHDLAWLLMLRLACAVLFFQPLLVLLKRRIRQTSEEICDDEVLRFGVDSQLYAGQLLDVASKYVPGESLPDCVLPMASHKSRLRSRIERILDSSRIISVAVSRKTIVLTVFVAALFTLITGSFSLETGKNESNDAIAAEEKQEEDKQATDDAAPNQPVLPYHYTFTGTVVDANDQPVADARVDFLGTQAVTDSEGRFHLTEETHLDFSNDQLNFKAASADGRLHGYYEAIYPTSSVRKPQSLDSDTIQEEPWQEPRIVLLPDLTMTGTVVDSNDQPFAGSEEGCR